MKNQIPHLVKWDLIFFIRYKIVLVAAVITALYCFIFSLITEKSDDLIILIIFSDPTFLGFLFIGVIILYEKSAGTVQALAVSPNKLSNYILSKVIALSIISVVAGVIMSFAGKGLETDFVYMFFAVSLSSALFILLGMVGVAKVKTFNQYILIIPMFFAPAILPLLGFFDFFSSPFLYLIPTKASLLLFEAAFRQITIVDKIYAFGYLTLWIAISYFWAYTSLLKNWRSN